MHIALIGKTAEPILIGVRSSEAVDKVYLLHSSTTLPVASTIQNRLSDFGISRIALKEIDPFSMESIVNTIVKIARSELDNDIYVNITGGTNLMAGAACAASFFVGANAYYILDSRLYPEASTKDLLVSLPIPSVKFNKELSKLQIKILQILLSKPGPISSSLLLRHDLHISPQRLSYNIRELVNKKLVDVKYDTTDSRRRMLKLTSVGKLHLSWAQ